MKIIEINPDFRAAVEANDGYCPCLIEQNEDTKCPCKEFREQKEPGPCHCGRFEKRMEKPEKVIAGLTGCIVCNCSNCEYFNPDRDAGCTERLMEDALEVIEDLKARLNDAKNGRLELGRKYQTLRAERDDLRKDIAVLTEELTGAHDECHRLAKSLSIARLQRKQAWEKLARITGEKYAEWLSESGEPVPEFPKEGM